MCGPDPAVGYSSSGDGNIKTANTCVEDDDRSLSCVIQHLCNDLLQVIDIEYGLVDWLISLNLLIYEQSYVIQNKPVLVDRISHLLDDVISWSEDQQEQFLHALDMTQQTHVVMYIRTEGIYSAEYGDNWPLAESQGVKALHRNHVKFIELTDYTNGLLEELFYMHFLSYRQMQQIEACKTDEVDRNETLYFIACRRSLRDFRKFIECLLKTGQVVIASVLVPKLATKVDALFDEHQRGLVRNWSVLVELIDVDSGLLQEINVRHRMHNKLSERVRGNSNINEEQQPSASDDIEPWQ